MNIIFLLIITIITLAVLYWIMSMMDNVVKEHQRNIESIKKDTDTLIKDFKVIAEQVEENNKKLDNMIICMLERIDEMKNDRIKKEK